MDNLDKNRRPRNFTRGYALLMALGLVASAASSALAQSGRNQRSRPSRPAARSTARPPAPQSDTKRGRTGGYDSKGRRDPFRDLTGAASQDDDRARFQGTLAGLLWTEVKLTSIMKTPSGNIALFEGGPEQKGYPVREGAQFWKATVQKINYETGTVTVREQLDDPRLIKPFRDIAVRLSGEDAGKKRKRGKRNR